MPETYSVTLVNESELDPAPTFVIFATLPVQSANPTGVLAWIAQIVPTNWHQVFTWSMDWQFAVSVTPVATGYRWFPSFTRTADPHSSADCASLLTMPSDGDLELRPVEGTPDGTSLTVLQAPDLPTPDKQPLSVAVGLSGVPVAATDAGPNLVTTFTTRPTYAITVGDYVSGQVIDMNQLVTKQELPFRSGVSSLAVTLDKDNTWTVQDSAEVDIAALFADRRSIDAG